MSTGCGKDIYCFHVMGTRDIAESCPAPKGNSQTISPPAPGVPTVIPAQRPSHTIYGLCHIQHVHLSFVISDDSVTHLRKSSKIVLYLCFCFCLFSAFLRQGLSTLDWSYSFCLAVNSPSSCLSFLGTRIAGHLTLLC